jgi:uncharacterized membrane protein YgdD (TMEM256/DUF423 family)
MVSILARTRLLRSAAAAWVCRLLALVILLFSGSLYLLAATGVRTLGAVTPLGGLCFIAGWLLLAWALARDGVR